MLIKLKRCHNSPVLSVTCPTITPPIVLRPADALLATNTSSLSITEIASAAAHPERVVGMHFFNPVQLMKLVEVVRTDETDAEVFEAPGLVAFPGMVETCISGGMDRPNESVDVTPFLDVNDSIDPVNFFYEDMRRAGVTTLNIQQGDDTVVAGRGMTVKPYGMTVEAMMVRPQSGIKISVAPKRGKSRAVQLMILRNAFADLRRALEGMVEEKQDEVATARREALAQGRDFEEPKADHFGEGIDFRIVTRRAKPHAVGQRPDADHRGIAEISE